MNVSDQMPESNVKVPLDSQARSSGSNEDHDPSDKDWGFTKAGKKRQRLPLACQMCRRKKVGFCDWTIIVW